MKKISYYVFITLFFLYAAKGRAQNIGINDDGSIPNPNAILDVKSNTKGMLIPRMSTTNRLAIPATKGMLVYDTTTSSFWYNTGLAWQNMNGTTSPGSGWSLTGNSGLGNTAFLGTNDFIPLRIKVNGQPSGIIDPFKANSFWGYRTGAVITQGNANTATGHFALQTTTSGSDNAAYGAFTLAYNSTGIHNTAVGSNASYNNTSGSNNTSIGYLTMQFNTTGGFNTAVGANALNKNTTALYNSAVGSYAMNSNTTGEYNAAVGSFALGANTTGMHNTVMGYGAMVQ